jgi:carbonic anhydrase
MYAARRGGTISVRNGPHWWLGKNPYASILSCADSRIGTEFAFDSFRGDLFVARVAGNFLNDDNVATFEYGVAVLNIPLLMVLGHSDCGAVTSTIKSLDSNTTLPGHLPSLVSALAPAVKAARGQPGDLLTNAVKANVRLNVERLKTATPILSKAVEEKKLLVVGGYYDLGTGIVSAVN